MKTVKVTMYLDVDDDAVDNVKTITHHADRLLDLDSWSEIESVHDVKVEEKDD